MPKTSASKKLSGPAAAAAKKVIAALLKQHGARVRADATAGATACARIWDFKQANAKAFHEFCVRQYVAPGVDKEALLNRLSDVSRMITGCFSMIRKTTRAGLDIADLTLTPAEELLGALTLTSHVSEDYRVFQIAQLVQLNFGTDATDVPTTRLGWAARRMSDWGRAVVPAALLSESSRVHAEVDQFVSGYNLYLGNITFDDPNVVFPDNPRLVSHWGLRDYMMQQYDAPHGLARQRAIVALMERVVDGRVPADVLDNADARWDLRKGTVTIGKKTAKAKDHGPLRWAQFSKLWKVARKIDPYTRYGNMIDTKFYEDREMTEVRVRKVLTDILSAPVAEGIGEYLAEKIGRPLEPFDIYYKKFVSAQTKAPLAFKVNERYATRQALQDDIAPILGKLGFAKDHAQWIAPKIRVDNGRSAGHAWSPAGEHDLQLLRVRVPADGVSEIEFSTYMHELGHCVEGVLSSFGVDHPALWGIPNTALTEAFAFTFQDRADEMLGRPREAAAPEQLLKYYWEAREIAGPALTELEFFHWLYKHPNATPAQMHKAIRDIGDQIWRKYHAKIFGKRGYGLMSVYSHMLWCDLYLADYVLGYVCAHQIREYLNNKNLGTEMPRMCAIGRVYPDVWMRNAVGTDIDAAPLLKAAAAALRAV